VKFNVTGLIFGTLFGFFIAAAEVHEYDTIHAMLRLDEIHVFLLMGSAVAVSAPLLWLLERRGLITPLGGRFSLSQSKPERKHVVGGALFGLGWAFAGTCPAPVLVMFSSGAMLSFLAIGGIFLGLHLHGRKAVQGTQTGDGEHRDLQPVDR
jgi:uncharacterized protein